MTLAPGTRLGPYEIVGQIGVGGMGEVWKARDSHLAREVAIKVLPAAFSEDSERIKRFHLETKLLASLSHPNLVQVFEAGEYEGSPFLVMELLEGETLRERMRAKPLAPKRAAEIARETAHGLAAAHEKGILHRDLKPENLFLTKDGRVKVLDFGLAKLKVPLRIGQESTTLAFLSEPGTVVGTVGYMSPEQVQGEVLDGRSDLFCLGIILWEMLTGRRPFQGNSSIELMHAILKEDPPELDAALKVPPELERIIQSCLAKEQEGRFHSAHDLAFALESAVGTCIPSGTKSMALPRGWRGLLVHPWVLIVLCGLLSLSLAGFAWTLHRQRQRPPEYNYKQLTFQAGRVSGARFGPDGRTIYFSICSNAEPPRVFAQVEGALGTPLPDLPPAHLLGVSPTGELALLEAPASTVLWGFLPGTLILAKPGAGASRPVAQNVTAADFAPDGKSLAVAFYEQSRLQSRLEFPLGKVIHQGKGWITEVRVAPDGRHLAFLERLAPEIGVANVWLARADGQAPHRILDPRTNSGLAWDSAGKTLTTCHLGAWIIVELDLQGGKRERGNPHLKTPILFDRDPSGRLLLGEYTHQARAVFIDERGQHRDLTWQDFTVATALSTDGMTMLFMEWGMAKDYLGETPVFVRPTSGGTPRQIGQGIAQDLSPDGKGALILSTDYRKLAFHPVSFGEPREVAAVPEGGRILSDGFAPDGRVFWSEDRGDGTVRSWIRSLDHPPEPLGLEAFTVESMAPDGKMVLRQNNAYFLWKKGSALPLSLDAQSHVVVGWLGNGALLVLRKEIGRCVVEKFDLATLRLSPWVDLTPTERGSPLNAGAIPCREGRAWMAEYGWYDIKLGIATPSEEGR